MHKRINITCMDNVIWYGPSCTWSPSCASWHDLHHSTGVAPRSMVHPPWLSKSVISYNKFVTLTISHHMPHKNKSDVSPLFFANFTWLRAFEERTVLTYEHETTTVINKLLTTRCRLNLNYSGRNRHPQSHLCNTSCMSVVEQVSCTRTCKVSPGRFIPLCH